jgi:hypothetical protein
MVRMAAVVWDGDRVGSSLLSLGVSGISRGVVILCRMPECIRLFFKIWHGLCARVRVSAVQRKAKKSNTETQAVTYSFYLEEIKSHF